MSRSRSSWTKSNEPLRRRLAAAFALRLAAVFVKEEWRHRGIASGILQEACHVARRVGVKGLYIDCRVNTVPLYEQNGWTILEREVGDGVSVVMLHALEG